MQKSKLLPIFTIVANLIQQLLANIPVEPYQIIIYLRDRSRSLPPQSNFIILLLNGQDQIKIPIPEGPLAGHVSLIEYSPGGKQAR